MGNRMFRYKVFLIVGLFLEVFGYSSNSLSSELKELVNEIESVTLYQGRAGVLSKIEAKLSKGHHTLKVIGLSSKIINNTFRPKVQSGNGKILGFSLKKETHYKEKVDLSEISKKLTIVESELASIDTKLDSLQKERAHHDQLEKQFQDSFAGRIHSSKISQSDLARFFELQASYRKSFRTSLRVLLQQRDDLIERRIKLRNQQDGDSEQIYYDYTAIIDFEAERPGSFEVYLEYMISGAGWKPSYDLRISKSGKARFQQNAIVWQKSGIDWQDVNLKLSNYQDSAFAERPHLSPLYLQYYKAKNVKTTINSSVQEVAEAPVATGRVSANQLNSASELNQGISMNFQISGKMILGSSDPQMKVQIAEQEITYDQTLRTVPSKFRYVYQHAKFKNPFDWLLPAGELHVFYEKNFLHKTFLEETPTQTEIAANLGIDRDIQVSYQLRQIADQGSVFKDKRRGLKTLLVLRNNSSKPKKLEYYEPYPISEIQKVKVDVQHEFGSRVKVDKQKGWYILPLELQPNSKSELEYLISVNVPDGINLPALSH